jgi:hypothetical protein
VDAVFLVPPDEESFRLVGERAIVINFKGVPQFDGELVEWRNRLQRVLDLPTLTGLPHRFDYALGAIGKRYAGLPDEYLVGVAREYGARYLVLPHALGEVNAVVSKSVPREPPPLPSPGIPVEGKYHARLVFENGKFYLYDLSCS